MAQETKIKVNVKAVEPLKGVNSENKKLTEKCDD